MYVGPAVSVGSPAQQDGRSSAARTACRPNGIAARSRASGRTPRTAWATSLPAAPINWPPSFRSHPALTDGFLA